MTPTNFLMFEVTPIRYSVYRTSYSAHKYMRHTATRFTYSHSGPGRILLATGGVIIMRCEWTKSVRAVVFSKHAHTQPSSVFFAAPGNTAILREWVTTRAVLSVISHSCGFRVYRCSLFCNIIFLNYLKLEDLKWFTLCTLLNVHMSLVTGLYSRWLGVIVKVECTG